MRCADSDNLSAAGNASLDATWTVLNNQAILGVVTKLFGGENEC